MGRRLERVFHDLPDGAGAPPAIRTATKAPVDLGGGAGAIGSGAEACFDGAIRQDVTGADDHA
jgi:hypothetical protein